MSTINRVFDLLLHTKNKYQVNDILASKVKGTWIKHSIDDFINTANEISKGLLASGIKKDDKVAIMSPNRPEWNFCDFGIMQIGAAQVPMYPTLAENDIRFILNDAEIKIIFVSSKEIYQKVNAIKEESNLDLKIYTFDHVAGIEHWTEIQKIGQQHSEIDLEPIKADITSDDLLTLIYTSGTTGTPKGVMLTHGNLISNVILSSNLYPSGVKRALSFSPLSHIFERMVIYMYLYLGISIYYAESMETIVDNLKEVKPHCFTTVPRLLEKIYDKIVSKGHELTGVKKSLFFWALKLAHKYEMDGANGAFYEFKLKIARKLIFSKWKEGLGGNLDLMVSGSAALQPRLARIFAAAEIPVMEGYGLTETSPVISVNDMRNGGFRVGTVGKVIDNVDVKIADDGEILCKGPNVMMGYYKDEKLTSEVIVDGYFHTGDIGIIDKDGFLKITDRKKEMFKTSGGKYIAPQLIENTMKQSRFIAEIMVIGDGQKMPAAFIQLDFDFVKEWAVIHGIDIGASNESIVSNVKVIERVQEEIDRLNVKFGNWEKVKCFELTPDVWSIEGGQLTPTLKLKRKKVMEKYINLFHKIYG